MKSPAKPEPKARAVMGAPEDAGPSNSNAAPIEDINRAPAVASSGEDASEAAPVAGESVSGGVSDASGSADSASEPTPPSRPAPSEVAPAEVAPAANKIRRDDATPGKSKKKSRTRTRAGLEPNNVRKLRQEAMMSKAELARRAGVSPLTIDRVEAGCPCRMDTKRKILEALGLKPSARAEVWPDIDAQS
jgi:DNA-binding XRE family transcriptional regulator